MEKATVRPRRSRPSPKPATPRRSAPSSAAAATPVKVVSDPATAAPTASKRRGASAAKTPKPEASAVIVAVEPPDEWSNERATAQARRAAKARQSSGRRRFVDPTTCDKDYSMEELEFMAAIEEYKKSSGRYFPTWSEVLEVLTLRLGYRKLAPSQVEAATSEHRPTAAAVAGR